MIPLRDDIPTQRRPVVTIALIVINCGIFLYEMSLGTRGFSAFTFKWGLIPAEAVSGIELTPQMATAPAVNVFTSMFMHGGFLHLGGNMLYLWIFGNNVEDVLGRWKFVLFYLASGIAAAALFIATDPSGQTPMIGASGAISGVLGAYIVTFPRARVLTLIFLFFFIRVIEIPALFVLGFWFLLQVLNGMPSLGAGGGGVAWFAHVGGFLFGVLVFKLFVKRKPVIELRSWR
jgi:membrane associated rhomboid family serine protease